MRVRTAVSDAPTVRPTTGIPTANPTNNPTDDPTNSPTNKLTVNPTNDPTSSPQLSQLILNHASQTRASPKIFAIRHQSIVTKHSCTAYCITLNAPIALLPRGEQKSPTFRVHFVITAAIRAI